MPRTATFDLVVPGTPKQVAARLRAKTTSRMFPHQSSYLGKGGLGGRVSDRTFTVADDAPTWIAEARPVAHGTFEDAGNGTTRVHGTIGMPAWVTWLLRIATLLTPLILMGGGLLVTLEDPSVTWLWLAFLACATPVFVFSVGRQVADADAGIDALTQQLGAALAAPPLPQEQVAEPPRARRVRRSVEHRP